MKIMLLSVNGEQKEQKCDNMRINGENMKEDYGIVVIRNFINPNRDYELNHISGGIILIKYNNIGNDTTKEGKLTIKCTERQYDKIMSIINKRIEYR